MRHIFLAFLLAVAACCGSGMDDPVGRDATGRGTACSVARGGRRRSRRRCALSFSGRAGARRLPDVPGGQRLEPRRLLGPDRDACLLYETYDTHWNGSGYDAGSGDRKSTRLNSSHGYISYAVFCLKKKKKKQCTHLYTKKKKNIE